MGKIGFMINTEYHLILTCSIMQDFIAKGDEVYIYRVSPSGGSRLNNLNVQILPAYYQEIIYDYDNPTKDLINKLDGIIGDHLDHFFFFLEKRFWLNYLFRKLKKNNTIIALAPDGMNAYENYYIPLKTRIKEFVKGLVLSMRCHSFFIPHVEKNFAASKYIDEVWVEYPDFFQNANHKRVVEFHLDYNDEFLSLLNKVFCFNPDEIKVETDSILYIDSSYNEQEYFERIITVIEKLRKGDVNKKVYIKLHQLSSIENAKNNYKKLENIEFLMSHYPAELYIANTKNCTILSLISTSMLLYNPTSKYYWIYPLFKDMYDYKKLVNPTNYIEVVSRLEQLDS